MRSMGVDPGPVWEKVRVRTSVRAQPRAAEPSGAEGRSRFRPRVERAALTRQSTVWASRADAA